MGPVSLSWNFAWNGQWSLNSWQNFAITASAILYCGYSAWVKGISPVGVLSHHANDAFVETLRKRFGSPRERLERHYDYALRRKQKESHNE